MASRVPKLKQRKLGSTELAAYLRQTSYSVEDGARVLNDLLQRQGIQPHYELAQCDGPLHDLTFHYLVSFDDFEAIGIGKSKKEAMNAAANNILRDVKGILMNPNDSSNEDLNCPEQSIADLLHLCRIREFSLPAYEDVTTPNDEEFTIACYVSKSDSNFKTIGHGKNKKNAKRSASKNMLLVLRDVERS